MNNLSTYFRCDIAEDRGELGKSVVTHLPPTKTLHCLDIERFKSDERIGPHQLPSFFPLPSHTLISDASVKTRQITLSPSVVGRAFLLMGKNAVKSFLGLQVLLKEFRTLNGRFVRAGKVGFQTEVQADCMTQPWKNLICCLIFNCETKPKIVHRITFHREGLQSHEIFSRTDARADRIYSKKRIPPPF